MSPIHALSPIPAPMNDAGPSSPNAASAAPPATPLSRRDGPPKKTSAPMTSNAMLATTGASLIGEGYNHFLAPHNKGLARALVGNAQAMTGLVGIGHYGQKFAKEPSVHNGLGLLASALFVGEGTMRMAEGEFRHPNRTSLLGFLTAMIKCGNGGPLTSVPFAVDALCNGAEFVHGSPAARGLLKVAHELTQHWKTEHLAMLQRGTGRVMILIAAAKTLALQADRTPAPAHQDSFARDVGAAYERLDGDAWERALADAEKCSPETAFAKLGELVAALEKEQPTLPRQLAAVIESAPSAAAALLKQYPRTSRGTLAELRKTDPARYDALREKYQVDRAFSGRSNEAPAARTPTAS